MYTRTISSNLLEQLCSEVCVDIVGHLNIRFSLSLTAVYLHASGKLKSN